MFGNKLQKETLIEYGASDTGLYSFTHRKSSDNAIDIYSIKIIEGETLATVIYYRAVGFREKYVRTERPEPDKFSIGMQTGEGPEEYYTLNDAVSTFVTYESYKLGEEPVEGCLKTQGIINSDCETGEFSRDFDDYFSESEGTREADHVRMLAEALERNGVETRDL